MILRREVEREPSGIGLYDHRSRFVLWGSCFADHLRSCLAEALYRVTPSPYGIMYNPLSMAEGMRRLLDDEAPREEELVLRDGRWHSMMHHGSYSHSAKEVALGRMQTDFARAREALREADLLVLTFGTARVYELEGEVVNNCHKLPEGLFSRRRLSAAEIIAAWSGLIDRLTKSFPRLRLLLTVSPVPHYRDGAHESRLSKATLLLATDELVRTFPERVAYFPAYEILQDKLRDYRFYGDDVAHPSDLAVTYIMERFRETFLREETSEVLKRWEKARPRLHHRPLTDDREALLRHYTDLLRSLKSIQEELPTDYLRGEIGRIQETLSTL